MKTAGRRGADDGTEMAGGGVRRAQTGRYPAGRLRARRRTRRADRGGARGQRHARRRADHRGGGHRAGRRRLARRAAFGAADAVLRRRQLHQHALAADQLPDAVPDPGDDARRVGRVQSVAGADGQRHARRAGARRRACPSRRPPRGRRRHRRCRRLARLRQPRAGGGAAFSKAYRRKGICEMSEGVLDRRAVAATLLKDAGDLLVVTGLGSTTYDAGAAGDRDENFYLWGAMGGAAMIGLGLALAQPNRRVLVMTGDGEMLMGMGSLASVTAQRPDNLSIAIFDNARFGETGAQRSHTAYSTDLGAVAAACGWRDTVQARTMA